MPPSDDGAKRRSYWGTRVAVTPDFKRAARHGWSATGFVIAVLAWLWALSFGTSTDSFAYWSVDLAHPWTQAVGSYGAFTYSPVMAIIFAPFHALPYPVFFVLWTTMLAIVALWLCPPILWAPGFILLLGELHSGNIHILLAAATVLALTRSAAWWTFPLLTKVTPAVGLLWHLLRREWRQLALALGVTAALVLASLLFVGPLWIEWIEFLLGNIAGSAVGPRLDIPLLPRLVVASVIVVYAARKGLEWLVPLGVLVALPVIWIGGIPAFFLASARLVLAIRVPTPVVTLMDASIGTRPADV